MLLSLDSRGCPRTDSESDHTVEFLLCRHIDRAVKCAEHTAAVRRGGVGVALDLAHVGEGVVDVAAVFRAVLLFHIFVELAVEGVDDHAVGKAVIIYDLKHAVADLVCDLVASVNGVLLELDVESHSGMILDELHKLDERGDALARKFLALPRARVESFQLGESLVADLARAVCGAVDGGIVDADKLAVAGDADVGLDLVNTDLDSLFEGEESIFGVNGAPTAVSGNVYIIL